MKHPLTAALTLLACLSCAGVAEETYRLDIDLASPEKPVPETLYGIFFEDINFGADGGLYAELVKNRSFEYPADPLQGWKAFGRVTVRNDGPFARCPHYVRLSDPGHPHRWTGIENEGFFGIGVREGETCRFSVWARVPDGGSSRLRIDLDNPASPGEKHYLCRDTLTVSGKVRLCDLLNYFYVLIPVFDLQKHYYTSEDEIRKLLDHGEGWLASHPAREKIVKRYFSVKKSYARRREQDINE